MKTNLKKLIKFDFIKKRKLPENLKHGLAIFFLIGIIFAGLYGTRVRADNPTEFAGQGFAYGSINDGGSPAADTGIGYISFGCESDGSCGQAGNYGVRINTDPNSSDEGKFFGYAWSSNYGWISFNHNDVQSCGANGGLEINGDVQAFIANNTVQSQVLQGFAKVLNAGGGWDGCINFSGMTQMNITFQTTITKQMSGELTLNGLAWGSPVIGWIDFDCQQYCGVEFIPNDVVDPVCPAGTTGTPPNCIFVTTCPAGTTGTPPDCGVCPPGTTGVYPKCDSCPAGTTGTPPNCLSPNESDIELYIEVGGTPALGNTTDTADITNPDDPIEITLLPVAYGVGVQSCSATTLNSAGATVSIWNGTLSSMDSSFPIPLFPGDTSNEFDVSISGYTDSVITFKIQCIALTTGTQVSGEAFLTIGFPEPFVDIDADPLIVEPQDSTELSWNFWNVQENSCQITGVVEFTPEDETDPLAELSPGDIPGFTDANPNNPGSTILSGINFAVGFKITCIDYEDNSVSDTVFITTTIIDCPPGMEPDWCSNDINPIFEEF